MRSLKKHSQIKKTSAGESGSALSTPMPDPGTVNSDPAEASYMTVREKKELFKVMKVTFLNQCVRCEGKSNLMNIERDHIIPRYQGGSDEPNNWQPLCAKCNSSKGPENTDWRISFAEKHNRIIPKEWLL